MNSGNCERSLLWKGERTATRQLRRMKHRTLLFSLLLPAALHAQVRMGPRVGLALATQTAGQLLQWQGLPKLGPIVGWNFLFPWTDHVGIAVEPTWISEGSWTRNAQLNTNTFVTFHYLELPVLLHLDLDTIPDGLFLNGGLSYGYWLDGRYRTTQDGQEVQNVTYDLSQPNVRRSQWCVALGMGTQGPRWGFEVRVQQSITPFDKIVRSQNLVFGLNLSYRLPLAGEKKVKEDEDNG